jgi:hypothetical protein
MLVGAGLTSEAGFGAGWALNIELVGAALTSEAEFRTGWASELRGGAGWA